MIKINKVENDSDITLVENLAKEIMLEHYIDYIPKENIQLFINEYQSFSAIKNQIEQNYRYYVISMNNIAVGYIGIELDLPKLKLSKLYLLKNSRGNQIGEKSLQFVEEFALKNRFKTIELIVNQKNLVAISFYEKYQFKIKESLSNYYANNHTEEDYRMEKKLNN